MATSVVNPRAQFFANNGRPLIGGRIHTYVAGSSTRARTYKDAAKAQPNTNPIVLDGRGEAQIYLAEGIEYKFVVEDSKGALIYTQEPVYGAIWPNAEQWPSDATLAYQYMMDAKAAVDSMGVTRAPFETYAQALNALPDLTEGERIEVSIDETRDRARTRYKVEGGELVFVVNLDQVRQDLDSPMGTAMLGFEHSAVYKAARRLMDKLSESVSIKDFGAIGDKVLHPLSERFSSLAMAQVAYPHATSLSQSIDWAATQAAINSGYTAVHAPAGHYMMSDGIDHKSGVTVFGDGVDLFIQSVPQEGSWEWSDKRGTHFYFCGTGAKIHTMDIISNTQPVHTIGGVACEFLHFTKQDSAGGAPATPKPFSVAWLASHNSVLKDCRIIPNHGNGLDGYLTRSGVLSDEWDIGVWAKHPQEALFQNVQSVGHWRMAAWLQTESPTGDLQWNTSERARYEKCVGVGVRGLAIRHHPVYWITANTASSITIKWVPSLTVTRFPRVRTIQGVHTYTGYSFDPSGQTVTLTGVSPEVSGDLTGYPLRSGYSGNNLSNTVFQDCVFSPFDYGPTMPTTYFGLPAGFAAEFDGFPLRNPVFINTVFQTRWDVGNTLWGACNDFKYVGCKHENGLLIANDQSIAGPMHANNLRFIAEDSIWYDTQLTYFKPRSAIVDSFQNNQQATSGEFFQRPLPGKRLVIQNQAGNEVLSTSATDGQVTLKNGSSSARIELPEDGVGRIRMDILRFLNAAGTEVGRLSGSSATPTWELKGNVLSSGYVRSTRDNTDDLGSGGSRWKTVFAATGTINTSDEREKTTPLQIADSILDAWGDIQFICFRWLQSIQEKGESFARWHFGVIAQQVRDAFAARGLDGTRYGLLCYDEWGDEYAPAMAMREVERKVVNVVGFEDDGTPIEQITKVIEQEEYDTGEVRLVRAAGNRWGIRADQCLFLEAAYQRREMQRLMQRVSALEAN